MASAHTLTPYRPSAATSRANGLSIPLGHRDADALDAAPAGGLFRRDREIRDQTSLGDLVFDLHHADGRRRRGATNALALYDLLGAVVFDDGFAAVSQREAALRLGISKSQVGRRMAYLVNRGAVEVVSHPWALRKSGAYRLIYFQRMLQRAGKLRDPRPEIQHRLDTPESRRDRQTVDRRDRQRGDRRDTLSTLKTQLSVEDTLNALIQDKTKTVQPGAPPADGRRPALAEESRKWKTIKTPKPSLLRDGWGEAAFGRRGA